MLRYLARTAAHHASASTSALKQQKSPSQSVMLLLRRPNGSRNVSSSRIRRAEEKPHENARAQEGQKQPDALVLTPYEKVTATATSGFWLGLIGLGCVGIYFVARELLPNRMSPNGLFNETLAVVTDNTDVSTRIGLPIHGYGRDHGGHREGRRNRIESVQLKDKNGKPRLRIKYNIKGPNGHGYVFCETHEDMKKGEFVYLIVQLTKSGELITIEDNRRFLEAESDEERDALRQLLGKQ